MTPFEVLQLLALYLGGIFLAALASIIIRAKAKRQNKAKPEYKFQEPVKRGGREEEVTAAKRPVATLA